VSRLLSWVFGEEIMRLHTHKKMAIMDPASQLAALVEHIRPRYERTGLASLNETERTLLALFDLDNGKGKRDIVD
jgi:hypothetical protein